MPGTLGLSHVTDRTQRPPQVLWHMTVKEVWTSVQYKHQSCTFTLMSSSLETSHGTNLHEPGPALFSSASRPSPAAPVIHVRICVDWRVLRHPGHGTSRCCIVEQLDFFQCKYIWKVWIHTIYIHTNFFQCSFCTFPNNCQSNLVMTFSQFVQNSK